MIINITKHVAALSGEPVIQATVSGTIIKATARIKDHENISGAIKAALGGLILENPEFFKMSVAVDLVGKEPVDGYV